MTDTRSLTALPERQRWTRSELREGTPSVMPEPYVHTETVLVDVLADGTVLLAGRHVTKMLAACGFQLEAK